VESIPACVQVTALTVPVMERSPLAWTISFTDDALPPCAVGFWQQLAKSKWLWN